MADRTEASQLDWDDKSKVIFRSEQSELGVTDWGNLLQFAPFESGYCFLIVCGVPTLYDKSLDEVDDGDHNFDDLQKNFVYILENEFKGLSGLEDYSTETYQVGTNNSQQTVISKVKGMSNANITMNFTEKTGIPINKYITEYLCRIRNPYSGITSYGMPLSDGIAKSKNSEKDNKDNLKKTKDGKFKYKDGAKYISPYDIRHFRETFTMLYIVTDNTCLNVEKAFALINAKPLGNNYSDLFNQDKGSIGTKEISINWECSVREGPSVNKVATAYLRTLVKSEKNPDGKILFNSYEFPYTLSNGGGNHTTIDKLGVAIAKGEKTEGNKIHKHSVVAITSTFEVGMETAQPTSNRFDELTKQLRDDEYSNIKTTFRGYDGDDIPEDYDGSI